MGLVLTLSRLPKDRRQPFAQVFFDESRGGRHDLQKAIARVRFDVELENLGDPRAAASLAVAEVLIPAGDIVALKAVVAQAAWAAVESWEPPRVFAFLLQLAAAL